MWVFIAAIPAPVKTFPHGNQWHGRVTELAILKAVVAEGTSALVNFLVDARSLPF